MRSRIFPAPFFIAGQLAGDSQKKLLIMLENQALKTLFYN
jgi:hypothetical protein